MKDMFFVGSYSEAAAPGVHACSFDRETGAIELVSSCAGLSNPTFLAVDRERRKLFALTETAGPNGERRGGAATLDVGPEFSLKVLQVVETVPATTCHIELDRSRRCVIVSSYHGGMVGVNPVFENGSLGPSTDLHRHEGRSVLPVQDRPRAHSATVDPNNAFVVVCDLGADKLVTYRLDAAAGKLAPVSAVSVAPGAGPRHFAFHPSGAFAYVINELNATITAFRYDGRTGTLDELQTVPTLPADYRGDNACADIHLSADGRFLYGSNRGHDSIAVYRVAADGTLSLVQIAPVHGKHPRNFALSPDGRFLLAANRDTNDITVFRRSEEDGTLSGPVHRFVLPKPVCIKFW